MSEPVPSSWQPEIDAWRDAAAKKSADRLILVILILTLSAGCLLISAKAGTELGQRPWHANSILRPVVELLALNNEYPTNRGVEVKWLAQHLGSAAAVLAATILWFGRTRRDDDWTAPNPTNDAATTGIRAWTSRWTWVEFAQLSWLLFAGWMTLSAVWSPWPAASAGEGIRQLITIVGTIAIARSLSRDGARNAAIAITAVLTVVAMLGLWYFDERNPGQRLKFPIGNPIFMAACLIPGLTLAGTGAIWAGIHLFKRSPSSEPPQSATAHRRRNGLLLLGSVVAMIILVWALLLADSRGPILGLIFGIFITGYLWRIATSGRKVYLWVLIVLVVAFISLGLYSMKQRGQSSVDVGGRGATLRLRMYAWSYAWELFKQQPIIGNSQGAYLLRANEMSRLDAERDPLAFPGQMLGHAHNEYLEVLADLGLIGLLLLAGSLLATLRAAMQALRQTTNPRGRGCLLGLLAALMALLVEEASSVALRMPGLPIVFFAVLALLWAISQPACKPTPIPPTRYGPAVRGVGLMVGIAVSAAILALAVKDWHAALADQRAIDLADEQQWPAALDAAEHALHHRLVVEDDTEAVYQNVRIAQQAALARVSRFVQMVRRQNPDQPISRDILTLAEEDTAAFAGYFEHVLHHGRFLLQRSASYAYVAGQVGETWLLWRDLNLGRQQLKLPPMQAGEPWLEEAGQWLRQEYQRDRLDPRAALQAFSVSANCPLADRFDMLRTGIRGVPLRPHSIEPSPNEFGLDPLNRFEQPLAVLMQTEGFADFLSAQSTAAMSVESMSPDTWPDPYVPETYRLFARAHKLSGEFSEAVRYASTAVDLSARLRVRFPHALSLAQQDLAFYLLLNDPGNPGPALQCFEQAMRDWPSTDSAERRQQLNGTLALYQLAAGQEEQARQSLREIAISPSSTDQIIALGYHRLCEAFASFPLNRRPDIMQHWLDRAIELAPHHPAILFMVIWQDLDYGRDSQARVHLAQLIDGHLSSAEVQGVLQMLLERYPENELLVSFARQYARRQTSQPSNPDTEAPASPSSDSRQLPQPAWEPIRPPSSRKSQ